jgi:hypothetical protein
MCEGRGAVEIHQNPHRRLIHIILPDSERVFSHLSDLLQYGEGTSTGEGQSLFHVFVQREDFFNEILQGFTAAVQGSLLVLDASNAGSYLYSLPLFSALWSEGRTTFNKIIVAVVNKGLSNDVLRRIHFLTKIELKKVGEIPLNTETRSHR